MPTPERRPTLKAFHGLTIKDEAKGEVEAVVATLGVVDRDGDIIRPTALPKAAKVKVSSWGHDTMFGERPVGKGTLARNGDTLVFKGRLFLSTTEGRDTFEVLKELGEDTEWSFGFLITGWETPSDAEKKEGAFRVITKMEAFEVSPVMLGAGLGTHTVRVKSIASESQADGDGGTMTVHVDGLPTTAAEIKAIAARVVRDLLDRLHRDGKAAEGTTAAETGEGAAAVATAVATDPPASDPAAAAEVAQLAAAQKARDLAIARSTAEDAIRHAAAEQAEAAREAERQRAAIAETKAREDAVTASMHAEYLSAVRRGGLTPEGEFERFQRTMRVVA